MKSKPDKIKTVTISDGKFSFPAVFQDQSRVLFNLCCLGVVGIGSPETEESFNGKFLVDLGKLFFKEGFTDVCIDQSLTINSYFELHVYFRFKFDRLHQKTHQFHDEEDDYFCITILGCKNGKRYIRFSRDRGEVYYHDRMKESSYKPGSFYNVGEARIVHPLTKEGVDKLTKDIEITLKNRNEWW